MNAYTRTIVMILLSIALLEAVPTPGVVAAPPGTAFSYQGQLSDRGQPATTRYDLRFSLYTAATGGERTGNIVTNENVQVSNGLFATSVDFGLKNFPDGECWMEIGVRGAGSSDPFTALEPRQLLTPVPSALYATEAGSLADGAISGAALQNGSVVRSINGLRDDFRIVGGEGMMVDTAGGSIVITAAPPNCNTYSNCYWNLLGNGNITAGVNYLGTAAGELAPLEFRVNNNRSLLHTFTGATTSPNITGGYAGNVVTGTGGTIGGGGRLTGINSVQTDWGTVSGGFSNVVASAGGTIGGGATNRISGPYGVVGGGARNSASDYSVVGGGRSNVVFSYTDGPATIESIFSIVGGGVANSIGGGMASTIGGGEENRVTGTDGRQVHHATISGGQGNGILSDQFESHYSTVGGGLSNVVRTAGRATIGGGERNRMLLEGHYAVIGGGGDNTIDGPYGTISGGLSNVVVGPGNPDYATIGGGRENAIVADSHYATVAGGRRNHIEGFASNSSIGGGATNVIVGTEFATIGGGGTNLIDDNGDFSTIAGGGVNTIAAGSTFSAIGGGSSNTVSGDYGVVPGGQLNRAQGNYSFAAGRRAIAQHNGSFVWSDDTNADFTSTSSKQFAVRADNGVMIQANNRALDLRGGGSVRVAGAGIGTGTPAFIHRATAGNITGNFTTINHPHCNGDPNAILLVTQNWNPGGVGGTYNNHPIGVYYTGVAWAVFNQDLAAIPVNAAFNVLVIKP